MVKAIGTVLVLGLLSCWLTAEVVINEIMYDPSGTDTGYEWIELYNNGNSDINLEGARLQKAGNSFVTVFTFPHYILRAKRFVLIGEVNITQALFTANLELYNGGSDTDGVRYISADGNYTDTVLYDNPNENNLVDDTGDTGQYFAPDVTAGYSLARRVDGWDSNNCEDDFVAETSPTPGLPNRVAIDYGLADTSVIFECNAYRLSTAICNYSLADCDSVTIFLNVFFNALLVQTFDIQPVAAGNFIHFSTPLALVPEAAGTLQVMLSLYNDVNPQNNVWFMQLGNPQMTAICINELLYNPDTDNQEWIELHIPPMVGGNYQLNLTDAADNSVQITLPTLCPEYLVLCRNQALLLERYPDCPSDYVLQVSSLPILNNDGDILLLKDPDGVVIDSMSYVGVSSKKDYSLERHISADSVVSWHYSYAEAKATPGQENSQPPPPSTLEAGTVKVKDSPFNPLIDERMSLQFNFRDIANTINCYVYDLKGNKRHTIASGMSVGSFGEIFWDGKDKGGKPLPRGIYVLLVEARNSSNRYFLRKQLTVVLATN